MRAGTVWLALHYTISTGTYKKSEIVHMWTPNSTFLFPKLEYIFKWICIFNLLMFSFLKAVIKMIDQSSGIYKKVGSPAENFMNPQSSRDLDRCSTGTGLLSPNTTDPWLCSFYPEKSAHADSYITEKMATLKILFSILCSSIFLSQRPHPSPLI